MPVKYRGRYESSPSDELRIVVELPDRTKRSLRRLEGQELTVEVKKRNGETHLTIGEVTKVGEGILYLRKV